MYNYIFLETKATEARDEREQHKETIITDT